MSRGRRVLSGTSATPRSGVGTVVWYDPKTELPEPPESGVDRAAERERFAEAREAASDELERERERTAESVGEDEAAVFDAHIQFVEDPAVEDAVHEAINGGLPAPNAVHEAFASHIERFEEMDGRTADRADDLRDVRDRLVRILVGGDRVDLGSLPDGAVVLAERLTPSDTAQLDSETVTGFATVAGGRTSHAAIFARSLALPAVVGVGDDLFDVPDDATVLVDGDADELVVSPTEAERKAAQTAETAEVRHDPVTTADGREIAVEANVGRAAEIRPAVERGADGIGLFRTEFLFLDRESPPDEDEQYETIVEALDAFPEGRVVVRTLDIGGDKRVPYLDVPDEENPFLGERGIRRSLGPDSALFETQLRALCRAAADGDGDLAVMFPLIATVEEIEAALETVESVAADLREEGVDHGVPELGAMIETPSAVFVADALAARVDFLSVGTNDLAQYVMAAARENDRVADLRDPLHPGVLRAVRRTVEAGRANDARVGICGEMAGDPAKTDLLVGLGLDELSMSAVTIPEVKTNVKRTDADAAEALADAVLEADTRTDVLEAVGENRPSDS